MKIIELPGEMIEKRKKYRHKNLEKNKHAYAKLREHLVPDKIKLSQFRKWYHHTRSTKEKDILLGLGLDPWSVEGIKYVGDCKRYNLQLGDKIPFDDDTNINE